MDASTVLVAFGSMTGLGLILSSILVVANRKLYVYEDPRIESVNDMLPQSNCGACGVPGCRAFAEELIAGKFTPGQCTVVTDVVSEEIAELLGVDVGGDEKRVARLACAGGSNVARQRVHYLGLSSCQAATLVAGGGKGCTWGCLGLGDCEEACDFDALFMNEHGIPVVDPDKCVACDDCVDICPKDLFSLEPVTRKLWIPCKNLQFGDAAERECEVACNSCNRCVADAAPGLIEMKHNLAAINYELNHLADRQAIERCPTGAIIWIEENGVAQKGVDAKKIIRKTSLPVG
ncbi:MAG: RnfABCDGE type electron transport complex subunit B [Pseudomonadales bacterium]|nr:RnfABCDGE type electron transport complex subunit B [Pseudomonadales bacterium]MDP7359424.1 RnfABCDGE type electron transport complex subunit B [Pseudomonadales bacterium]MDP7597543.1 RnfABCDGE type electron transport complex subunit B [Pseudomonadales bacterium]HJN51028.1 RnfABCDGE type electron transport complex subunit B [Pseudomonadales bacterium]